MPIQDVLRAEKLRSLALTPPLIAKPGDTVHEVLERMRTSPDGEAVIVVDQGCPVGIFTERDVLMKVAGLQRCERPVAELMSKELATLRPDDAIGEAFRIMGEKRWRHVPLVDASGKLAGLVRVKDLLDWIAERYPQEVLNIPPRPHQRILQAEGG